MHRAVIAALARTEGQFAFSTITGRAGRTVTSAYVHGQEYPLWVAKTAVTPEARVILEREHEALEALRPWAQELRIPQTLAWEYSTQEACLILTTVPGLHKHFTLPLYAEPGSKLKETAPALAWLEQFRERVPVQALESLQATAETLSALEQCSGQCAALSGLADLLRKTNGGCGVAASHGDFYHWNILFDRGRVGVVDWDSLAARSPVHDVLSLFTGCHYQYGGRAECYLNPTIFLGLFFSESPMARQLRKVVAQFHLTDRQFRSAFYWFVGDNIRVTGGIWRETWFTIAGILEQAGFPSPWACSLEAGSIPRPARESPSS